MKVIKKENDKNKILRLNLLKLKLYKKKQYLNFNINLKKIELNLKKILHLIYEYHIKNKKILFLEFPKSFKHVLTNTKHLMIPDNSFYTNILNNRTINSNNPNIISKNKIISLNIIKILSKLNKKINLIVLYNSFNISKYNIILQKSYRLKIPVICCFNALNIKVSYKIATTYNFFNEKILNANFIITLIKTTLKRATFDQRKLKKNNKNFSNNSEKN